MIWLAVPYICHFTIILADSAAKYPKLAANPINGTGVKLLAYKN